jgi:DUF4097 and DUF4098 domain-containing protein YvlB
VVLLSRIVFFLWAGASAALALTEQHVNETFDVTAGARLIVDVDFGTIELARGSDSSKVTVSAHRKLDSDNEAREHEYFSATPLIVTKQGNTVTVSARRTFQEKHWSWSGRVSMDARYIIRVPGDISSEVGTGGGDIVGAELSGSCRALTSGGNMKFLRVRGPLNASSSGGHISLEACDGAIDVRTSGGKIDSIGGSGTLKASTAGGAIVVRNFNGDTNVETSGGRIDLDNIRGKLVGETSGGAVSATVPAPLPGDIKLETAAGRIDVALPADARIDLNAETTEGSVTSELPVVAKRAGRDGLQGTINGGGKALFLRTGAGNIAIKSTSPAH